MHKTNKLKFIKSIACLLAVFLFNFPTFAALNTGNNKDNDLKFSNLFVIPDYFSSKLTFSKHDYLISEDFTEDSQPVPGSEDTSEPEEDPPLDPSLEPTIWDSSSDPPSPDLP